MNVELLINNIKVDLPTDFDISFSKEVQNVEEFVVSDIEYSYEISLPVSETNKRVFNHNDVFDVTRKFEKPYKAVLYVNDEIIIDGLFSLSEVNSFSYLGNLYTPQKKNLTDILGDLKLKDITPHYFTIADFEDYTAQNKTVSEFTTKRTTDGDIHICFPLCYYGLPYNNGKWSEVTEEKEFQTTVLNASNLTPERLFPSYNVLSVIKDCFKTFDYNVVGNVFDNPKFNLLYQTYGGSGVSADDYADNNSTPYYVRIKGKYSYYNSDYKTISTTLLVKDDEGYKYGTDSVFTSNNNFVNTVDDRYGLVGSVANGNGQSVSLMVPKSGWYNVRLNSQINLPYKERTYFNPSNSEHYDKNLVTITGANGYKHTKGTDKGKYIEQANFKWRSYELHITKGDASGYGNRGEYVCFPSLSPVQPIPSALLKSYYGDEYGAYRHTILESVNLNKYKFYGNNGIIPMNTNSSVDVSNIVCAVQFGKNWFTGNNNSHPFNKNRKYVGTNLLENTPSTIVVNGVEYSPLQDVTDENNNVKNLALCYAPNNTYSNFKNGVDNISYSGQSDSYARLYDEYSGYSSVNTCVWLEEGEYINLETVSPYLNNCYEWEYNVGSGEFEGSGRATNGLVDIALDYDLEMTFISNRKDYKPSEDTPIYDGLRKTPVNVNSFLGDMKVNDYINNFLQTFHLKMTQVDSKTYSIDYTGEGLELGTNIINFDGLVKLEDCKFRKIDLESQLKLEWTIDNGERGYINGEHKYLPEFDHIVRDAEYSHTPFYKGEYNLYNELNTSGNVKTYTSKWSYTWFEYIRVLKPKDIQSFNPYDFGDMESTYIKVPVICRNDTWSSNTFSSKFKADVGLNSRLFYPYNRQNIINGTELYQNTPLLDFREYYGSTVQGELSQREYTAPWKRLSLIMCDNSIYNYALGDNGEYEETAFILDYNNSAENTLGINSTITDKVWKPTLPSYYICEFDTILPSEWYKKMNVSSRLILNDNTFQLQSIEGFSIRGDRQCTIQMIYIRN